MGWPQGNRSGNNSSKVMEHKTFNTDRKQHISVNTLVSDKTASDKQLTDSPNPNSLHNV